MTVPASVLSDGTILSLVEAGRITIDPWDASLVQPASVDLRLGDSFRVFHNHRTSAIDLRDPPRDLTEEVVPAEGEPFVIHPGEFVLGRTLEWVELPDDVLARVEGKALALDTPVPTPAGWRTMGELEVGDEVFDAYGRPTRIVAATEPLVGRACREVSFSDGTTVVADAEHQWWVRTKLDRRYGLWPRVVRTRDVEGALRYGAHEWNCIVPQAAAVEYREKDLPVDPYVLGAWLGDGTTTQANLTCADEPILEEVAAAGYGVEARPRPYLHRIGGAPRRRDGVTGRYTANGSLHSASRALGVLGDKHIPRRYMEGSRTQRQALLEGLMDTDGYAQGRCDLTTVKRSLAEQYRELIASLGFKPVIADKPARLYGRDCGRRYEVTFTPHMPVFRLPRKLARQKLTGWWKFGRAISGVRGVRSRPVRCIEVAAPEGVFLVTRSFIPTHNSSLGRLGLIVHATAGFVDPGWRGTLTLEFANLTRIPIKLRPGLPIAQLSFMALDRPALRPYGSPGLGSHYQGQTAATESRYEGTSSSGSSAMSENTADAPAAASSAGSTDPA
jgi:deoxycytidine triphosphate deaminase